MVAVSGYKSLGTKASGKPQYDGTLKQWPTNKVAIKSYLQVHGVLQVVKEPLSSVSSVGLGPGYGEGAFVTPLARGGDRPESMFKLLVHDEQGANGIAVLGPFDQVTLLQKIQNGEVQSDQSLIARDQQSPVGSRWSGWEPFTHAKVLDLHEQVIGTSVKKAASMVGGRDEFGNSRSYNEMLADKDQKAYHLIVGCINVKTETGATLVQQIDDTFGDKESGRELFNWLDGRAKASGSGKNEGLVNADDAKADVVAFALPVGELTN
jgi:hypothetical protein